MDLRDSYVPVFTGQPADYREWRQRIQLYHRKMSLTKRANESVLNLVGSFTGVTWRLFQDWGIDKLEKEDAFKKVIKTLDANFSYDAKVQLPTEFEAYFNLLQRSPGQTLLLYVADHEEAYRKLQQHRIELSSSPTTRTPAAKRPASSTTKAMALERKIDKSALLIFQDSNGAERPECVLLDPGASAFLPGYGHFRKYLDHLSTLDFPIEAMKMSKGRRRFQFGGHASMWSDWSAHIPTFVDGKYGTIELFLLPGNTPMLCGRPMIEALAMTMDFAQRPLRIGSSPWMRATLGRQGEYLWPITNEHLSINYDHERPRHRAR